MLYDTEAKWRGEQGMTVGAEIRHKLRFKGTISRNNSVGIIKEAVTGRGEGRFCTDISLNILLHNKEAK